MNSHTQAHTQTCICGGNLDSSPFIQISSHFVERIGEVIKAMNNTDMIERIANGYNKEDIVYDTGDI